METKPIKTSKMFISYANEDYIDGHFEELYGFEKGSEKAKEYFSKLDKPLTLWQKVKRLCVKTLKRQ